MTIKGKDKAVYENSEEGMIKGMVQKGCISHTIVIKDHDQGNLQKRAHLDLQF